MSTDPLARPAPSETPGRRRRILIVAGEPSGDLHGSRLVESLLACSPDLDVYGIGGDAMQGAGFRVTVHISELAVMGLVEVAAKWRQIRRAFHTVADSFARERPDVLVLIDFPDFNLRLARRAARRGIPVVYYISPQLWAWRRGRIGQIREHVDHMLVIFPFEADLYDRAGVRATYVGHPLMDRYPSLDLAGARDRAYEVYGVSPLHPVVGLFPGSRASEVRALLPTLLDAAEALQERIPRVQFLLGESPTLEGGLFDGFLAGRSLPVRRARTGIEPGMGICDVSIVASGSATLEAALFGMPMVIVYRVSPLTYLLGRLLIRVQSIGMVNLVLQRGVVPELIQGEVNRETVLAHCLPFLTDAVYASGVRRELAKIRSLLGEPGASARAARIVLETAGRGGG